MATLTLNLTSLRTRARIAAASVFDSIAKPRAHRAEDVPWHGEAVTAQWLNAVLQDRFPGAVAQDVEIVGGDDGSSSRRVIGVTWNQAGANAKLPATLFTKITPTLPTRLSAGMNAPTEGRFLLEMKPHLDIEAPYCLFSARDPVTGRSIHLMEDLTVTKGADFCSARTRIQREQAEQIISTLARLHGAFLNPASRLDSKWLATYEDFFRAATRSGIQAGHDQALEQADAVLPAGVRAQKHRIWSCAQSALAMHDDVRTVIHSDVHLGNWYVTRDGVMGLCDWARVCRGHWARDLAYALTTTLSVEDRRTWERDLLRMYLDALQRSSGSRQDFDTCWDNYRRQILAALLMWTPTLCPPELLPDMQPRATSMLMIERIATAMDDHEVLSLFGGEG